MQHEDDALKRRQPLQHHEHREGNVFGANGGRILCHQRLRQPFPDIGFTSGLLVAQAIEAEAGGDCRKIGFQRTDRILRLGIVQAHEGVLHDLLGVRAVTGDPVSQREHRRPQLGKGLVQAQAEWPARTVRTRCTASFASCHDTRRRPNQKKKPGILRSSLSA